MSEVDHKKIIEDLKIVIADSIQKNVNGKIDKLTAQVTDALAIAKAAGETSYYNSKKSIELHKELNAKFDQYIEADTKRWNDNMPYLKALENVTGAAKILVWIAGGLGTLSVGYLLVREWVRTLTK